jgi:hypothetical protein
MLRLVFSVAILDQTFDAQEKSTVCTSSRSAAMAVHQSTSPRTPRTPSVRRQPSTPPQLQLFRKEIDDEVNLIFYLMSGEVFPMDHMPKTVGEAREMALFEVKRRRGDFKKIFWEGGGEGRPGGIRVNLVQTDGTLLLDGDFIMNDMEITVVVVEDPGCSEGGDDC